MYCASYRDTGAVSHPDQGMDSSIEMAMSLVIAPVLEMAQRRSNRGYVSACSDGGEGIS